ncbi:serine/threonine-protein kinase [Bradymonas sediminis]|uniref:non-specific serine/threonine protein kinase n=1 Tax=Bradymonas sediminis TaxID=1548548 RepID=A0A2Z4FQA8_9DELT|nr:serine/threonine-protein kinase [Bradymonas sediminis]AWV91110.1 hypothetical protein DN745_17940 [Bradymonas sediminis]TDP75147.1 serine/threonine protein kinase [Bradymonas sediminis]
MAKDPHLDSRTLDPGTVVMGRYVVEEKIAEGGMASIHRTFDRKTGRYVVLKALYPFYCEQPVVCTRFLDEGRIQRYLAHPNIIDVFDIVETSPLAIIMEYIQGPTLEDYLAERGPLNTLELLNLMLPVLSAVGFAHRKGIIHRDIKPSNILLKETDAALVPKVMDFGVAKVVRGQDLTADGTTVGTLHYMSPEQIVGSKGIDGRADIYSLGVTLYKLSTGEVPFNAATEFALMMAQVEAAPTPPRQLRPEIPEALEAIILRTLAKKPEGRFQNIGELTGALLELKRNIEAGDNSDDTLTLRFSDELLLHAMMANEVAVDRTSELNILESAELANLIVRTSSEGETIELDMPGSSEPTMQLDRARLRAKMRADRDESLALHGDDLLRIQESGADTKDTRPIELETTREQNSPDSRAFTRPFTRRKVPGAPAKAAEANALAASDDPTTEAPRPPDLHASGAHARGLLEESAPGTAEPSARLSDSFYEVDLSARVSRELEVPRRTPHTPQRAAQPHGPRRATLPMGSGGSGAPKIGPEDIVDGFNSPEFAELRARASGGHSQTKLSRDEVLEEFGRQLQSEPPAKKEAVSTLLRVLIGVLLVLFVGLLLALAWSLLGK